MLVVLNFNDETQIFSLETLRIYGFFHPDVMKDLCTGKCAEVEYDALVLPVLSCE